MTPRKAGTLAMQLPAGAQTWKSCGYDAAWTEAEHLAALAVDVAQVANWQRGGGSRADLPTPIRRPSQMAEERAKPDNVKARAEAYARFQQSRPTNRPRDARGRFVKEA